MDNLTPCEGREAHARERPVKQSNGPHAANIPSLATKEQRQQRAIHERRSVTFPLHMTHEEQNKVLADLKKAAEEKKAKERAYARKYYAEHREQCLATQKRCKAKKHEHYKQMNAVHAARYYQQHREKCRANAKRFCETHPDYFKEYYQQNKERWRKGGGYR